ncbi:MAG: Gar1/Naf1 family protein [archaeon]|jgi:rRNA processing protein Gar1|nr:Gar1/Naf1 family protein [archaeon]HIK01319.1 hypothetical protein [Candidatus Undinarchaeales archaeon ERR594346 U_76725]|tara:strand:+ start:20162 stop:20389 length:228 start_codon:yes stop_codon:yes gene_type:complete
MGLLGKVLHLSKSGNIIVSSSKIRKLPRTGAKTFDSDRNTVGKISEVFGPVSSPYISVKPVKKDNDTLLGKMVYV